MAKEGRVTLGGIGNNGNGFYGHNIAEALLQGLSVGDALLTHFCTPLVYPWSESFELHTAPNVFVGELTLTLLPVQFNRIDPVAPTLRFPPYGATATTTDATLVWWNSYPEVTAYRVQLSTSPDFSTTLFDQSGITANSLQVSNLSMNTEYFWRVTATNEGGTSDWSNIRNFDTIPLQSTIYVPRDYPTIQQALDAAMPGASIIVGPGVYEEIITMKEGVSLIGSGFAETIIDGQSIGNGLGDQTGLNGNISVGPRFVDREAENCYLLEDSPCINAGDPATTLDLDGAVADIGKFAFDFDLIDTLSASISTLASASDEAIVYAACGFAQESGQARGAPCSSGTGCGTR
ncbi:MAG: hypothetical protein JSW66_11125 [Phycisphaerales bacterium]|nr:MAG: hypothetical protein JSW66_11125 [Phycisphaerales bacterium]